jgi:GMP synthase-like glutamine amidotransferase
MAGQDADPAFFDLDVPILGICYGLQEIAWRLSKDNVIAGTEREYGRAVRTIPFSLLSGADKSYGGPHTTTSQQPR